MNSKCSVLPAVSINGLNTILYFKKLGKLTDLNSTLNVYIPSITSFRQFIGLNVMCEM